MLADYGECAPLDGRQIAQYLAGQTKTSMVDVRAFESLLQQVKFETI